MKRATVLFVLLVLCFSMLLPMSVSARVVDIKSPSPVTLISSEQTISPRADVIVVKFRVYNGVLQYRRWNETWGYWVDDYWKNVV